MHRIPFIDLRAHHKALKSRIDHAVKDVLDSGNFILGERVKNFEKGFASYLDSRYAAGVASGTEAIYLSLAACSVGPGDEVITAPNTTAPTVAAIYMAGASPVFADIDERTLTIKPSKVRGKISRRTKAIIPVHLYGNPADMDQILRISKDNELYVIEDACQAHGAAYKRKKVGTIGDVGCFSFYPTKNLGCLGDGGMVVTNQKSFAEKIRRLRSYGEAKRYKYVRRGINSRLDEIQAAVLSVKLKYLDSWNKRRRYLAAIYDKGLNGLPVKAQEVTPGAHHVYHLYVIMAQRREALIKYLGSNGIQALVHYPDPLYRVKPYAGKNITKDFPVCEKASREILSLPLYPEMSDRDAERVVSVIRRFYRG